MTLILITINKQFKSHSQIQKQSIQILPGSFCNKIYICSLFPKPTKTCKESLENSLNSGLMIVLRQHNYHLPIHCSRSVVYRVLCACRSSACCSILSCSLCILCTSSNTGLMRTLTEMQVKPTQTHTPVEVLTIYLFHYLHVD